MSGIFDFIKKQSPNANGDDTNASSDATSASQTQPVVTEDATAAPMAQGQSYNGVGSPPSGQSYNGVGSPSSGQSYNGIGSPPNGQSYNGVGSPPSGQSYNGVGSAPVAQAGTDSSNNISDPAMGDPGMSATTETEQEKLNADAEAAAADAQKTLEESQPNETPVAEGPMEQPEKSEEPMTQTPDTPQPETPPTDPGQSATPDTGTTDISNAPIDKTTSDSSEQPKQNEETPVTQDDAKHVLNSQISDKKRSELDVMTHMTQRANKVFVEANNKAKELQNTYVDSEHLLHGLITDGEIYKILVSLKVQPQLVEEELAKVYKKEESTVPPQTSPRVKQIIEKSLLIARKMGYEFISPEHLLLALYDEGEGVGARILIKLGITKQDINKAITGKKEGLSDDATGKEAEHKSKNALEKYTIDLTAKAANGELDPVVERSDVIERVVHILSRRIKNNPALIGEPGVGKTAVIEGLAQRIVSKQVPESLLGKRILQLDLSSVVAGASHRGEFEERMKDVVDELKASKGDVIMFIDEMHTMMGAGSGEGAIDASNFIKPALARGEVQFIGATTITEYRKYIEKDAALERRFQTVLVPEPNEEATIKMLKASRDKYESFHKVKIPDEVIDFAVKLSKRYIGDRFLPDKAFDLMDEAAAAVRLPLISLPEEIKSLEDRISQLNAELAEDERRGEKVKARILRSKIDEVQAKLNEKKDEYNTKKGQTTTKVTPNIVKDIVAMRTGIPISKIGTSESDKLAKLEDIIHKRMINQERAVESVSQAVRRGRAGLKSNNRPIGSFVFLGPTGVGKTELAKTLSEVLFDEEEAVIRFDMTEYMERHEVAKLLGPPPGYVGFEEGGKLTEAVRRKPYSVVLFDEIEKAHPDIFNILLQILDDARLTDNKGRTISFKNTVVICTSNIGTPLIQKELLKKGAMSVTAPTVLSTYTFTPQGQELVTIGNKYFDRASSSEGWKNHQLSEYFTGSQIAADGPNQQNQQGNKQKNPPPNQQPPRNAVLPIVGYDTQAISPKGMEVLTVDDRVFMRDSTNTKVWKTSTLSDYFKDQIVVNALAEAPDEQLPTERLKTHVFTPDNSEMVTFGDRFWKRTIGAKEWTTGLLPEYFEEQMAKGKIFPTTHWDIHAVSPQGREVIVVGEDVWFHEKGQPSWTQQDLKTYYGDSLPLDKEAVEKEQATVKSDLKQYQVIKDKVMGELLKFFRPELVNRFDEVIVFEPLKYHHMTAIVKLQLKALTKLLEEQEIGFSVTDPAIKEIVRSGFDPVYGARPLRRAIQKLIENPISELIIAQKVKAGDTLIVDFDGQNFIFNIEKIERKYDTSGKTSSSPVDHKKFFCEKCTNRFETDVIPTATTICSACASTQVQEVQDETKEQTLTEATSTDTSESTSGGIVSEPKTNGQGHLNGSAIDPDNQQVMPSAVVS